MSFSLNIQFFQPPMNDFQLIFSSRHLAIERTRIFMSKQSFCSLLHVFSFSFQQRHVRNKTEKKTKNSFENARHLSLEYRK